MKVIWPITALDTPETQVYAGKNESGLATLIKGEPGYFIAESPLVIERALNAGYEPVSFMAETKDLETKAADLRHRCPDIPVYTADYDELTHMVGYALPRGMLCCMRRKVLPSMEALCRDARRVVVLEDVMNPTNVGAIIRSAAALSIDAVILTAACTDPLYRRAVRVSMGCVFQVPWTVLSPEETDTWIPRLKEMGFVLDALALKEDSVELGDPILTGEEKLAIIMGTEGEGLKDATIEACDHTVIIPMRGGVDSLNVAAASAVAFWELSK